MQLKQDQKIAYLHEKTHQNDESANVKKNNWKHKKRQGE